MSTKAEEGLQSSDFRLQTLDFSLQTSDFSPQSLVVDPISLYQVKVFLNLSSCVVTFLVRAYSVQMRCQQRNYLNTARKMVRFPIDTRVLHTTTIYMNTKEHQIVHQI